MATSQIDVEEVVAGNTRFAFDLYGQLRGEVGNIFFSPYSLSAAFAMISAGAVGDTAGQIADVLHFTLPRDKLHPAFHALIDEIGGDQPAVPDEVAAGSGTAKVRRSTLLTANALWGQKNAEFQAAFLELARSNYGAGLREVDFHHDPEFARKTINLWVGVQTHEKIRDLIRPSDIDRDTSLILTNAIYFRGDWAHPFAESRTRQDALFTGPDGKQIHASMMVQTHQFPYHDGGTFQLLELPYSGDDLAMVFLLPRDVDGLAALEARLTEEGVRDWLGRAIDTRVEVAIPRFTVTESFRLFEVLRQMGMSLAFDPRNADFSGINGGHDLSITEVVHKAFVTVNEHGTEAAAATAGMMSATMAVVSPRPVQFRADHPFVFLMMDRATGSLLFFGRVVDPVC